jgi:hypothetical protein
MEIESQYWNESGNLFNIKNENKLIAYEIHSIKSFSEACTI